MNDYVKKKSPKFRHELKYICSDAELNIIKCRLQNIMPLDPHTGESGTYNIKSMYFDDLYNTSYFDNEDGANPREKWRIRIYNNSDKRITLESKRKENDMILKKSCPITLKQFNAIAYKDGVCTISNDTPPLLNKFLLDMMNKGLKPVVIVQYDRRPFVYALGNVRVTFDQNIMGSTDFDHFFSPNNPCRPILPLGHSLLEVKYDEYIPDHIYHAIQMTDMQRTRFSKYYLCRKHGIRVY